MVNLFRVRFAAALLCCVGYAITASAAEKAEPRVAEIKGIRIGMTEPELKAIFSPLWCRDTRGTKPGMRTCSLVLAEGVLRPLRTSFAGAAADMSIFLQDGRVEKAGFNQIASSEADTVIGAIQSKYGKPKESRVDGMLELTGKTSDRLSTRWVIGEAYITVVEDRNPRFASVTVMLMPYTEKATKLKPAPAAVDDV